MQGTLSKKEYWDDVLREAKLPRIVDDTACNYKVTIDFIDAVLRERPQAHLLEIGAGSSAWLPYFHKKYNLRVSGLDYSEVGCRILEENLKLLHVPFEEIINEDIFKWNSDERYDIIFSYGVIEHFNEPKEILKICRDHLKPRGIIITLIPNLQGIMGFLTKTFLPEIFKIHKVISLTDLRKMHLELGLTEIRSDYVGTFAVTVIPWTKGESVFLRRENVLGKLTLKAIGGVNKISQLILRTLAITRTSKTFSPYIVSIMRNGHTNL
jgi:2-polyprenyl-3-methyl-5-hydroxy-6-metoxy-1,4-benzoquinol methylase